MQDEGVRRLLLYLTAWALAAAAIVGVSWFGINGALGAAVPARVSPLSLTDLRKAVPSPSPSSSPTPGLAPPANSSPSAAVSPQVPPSSAVESWRPTPDARSGTGYLRTFHTLGGDVVVLATQSQAKVLEAMPRSGWEAMIQQEKPEVALVTFVRQAQRNQYVKVSVSWSNGPVAEYTETFLLS